MIKNRLLIITVLILFAGILIGATITSLNEEYTPLNNDVLLIDDVTSSETKKVTVFNLTKYYPASSFISDVTAIGTGSTTMVLYDTQNLTGTSITIPSNINVVATRGGNFTTTSSSGITVNFHGSFEAPMSQVFGTSVTPVFHSNSVPAVYPEWFGVSGVSGSDDKPAIQRALDAASSCGEVRLVGTNYYLSDTLYPTADNVLYISPKTTLWLNVGTRLRMIQTNYENIKIYGGGTIDGYELGQRGAAGGTTVNCVYVGTGSSRFVIDGMTVKSAYAHGIRIEGAWDRYIYNPKILNCEIYDCNADSIDIGEYVDYAVIANNNVHDSGVSAVDNLTMRNISFRNNNQNAMIYGNIVSGASENGLYIWSGNTQMMVYGNSFINNGHYGLEIVTASPGCIAFGNTFRGNGVERGNPSGGLYTADDNIYMGNSFFENDYYGIYSYRNARSIFALNSAIDQVDSQTNQVPAGIRFDSATSSVVLGNICSDREAPISGTSTQEYGINLTGTQVATVFMGNVVSGNSVVGYLTSTGTTIVNIGNIQDDLNDEWLFGDYLQRHTRVQTATGNLTFTADHAEVYVINPNGDSRSVNPSGPFEVGHIITLVDSGSVVGESLLFDTSGVSSEVDSGASMFVYAGANGWKVIN